MIESEWKSVPEEFENIRDKWDYLDWDRLPAGTCDMNYRPSISALALPLSIVLLVVASWACLAITDHFRRNLWLVVQLDCAVFVLIFMGLVAMTWAFVRRLREPREGGWGNFGIFAAALAVGPVFLWVILIAMPFTRSQLGALIVLAIFVFPATLILADALATHSVHWLTAHPGIDHATMIGWRADWTRRWTTIPTRTPRRADLAAPALALHQCVMRQREKYLDGVLLLFALTVVVPIGLYLLIGRAPPFRIGAGISVVLLLGLAVVGSIRCVNWPGSFRLYLQCLANWLTHQQGIKTPPWVFQSPFGTWAWRVCFTLSVLFLANAALIPLADWANWLILSKGQRDHISPSLIQTAAEFQLSGLSFLPVVAPSYGGLCLFARWLACLLLPVSYLILAGYLVAGPVIAAHHAALEAPGAYEQHSDWNRFDGYVERLQHSSNPFERSALFIGLHTRYDYPMLLDGGLLFEHLHLLGGTGTGKTALGLTTHMIQLIRRNDGAVVIIDCKGDSALFHTARLEAQKAGRTFKWLTNKPGRATYIFNPLDSRSYRHFTLAETVGFLSQVISDNYFSRLTTIRFPVAATIITTSDR